MYERPSREDWSLKSRQLASEFTPSDLEVTGYIDRLLSSRSHGQGNGSNTTYMATELEAMYPSALLEMAWPG